MRTVSSAALDIAAEPDQVVGGAARQAAGQVAHEARRRRRGSSVTCSTGLSLTTQTSAAWPPRCMAMAVASSVEPMRAKPPGMTVQPSRRARQIDAQAHRARLQPAVDKTGVVDSVTASCPTKSAPSVAIRSSSAVALGAARAATPSTVAPVVLEGQARRKRRADHHAVEVVAARARAPPRWPHHQVAMVGSSSGSPSSACASAAGRQAARASRGCPSRAR